MNRLSYFNQTKNRLLIIGFVGILAGILAWYYVPKGDALTIKETYYNKIRDGVGSEVVFFDAETATPSNVSITVSSLANFVDYRSSINLADSNKNLLFEMESSTFSNKTRRLKSNELSEILTTVAMEKLDALTDGQIDSMAETLRGFNAPDLPQSFKEGRNTIRYRPDEATSVTPQVFTSQLKQLRNNSELKAIYQNSLKELISKEISKRISNLSVALPESFGSAETKGLTPSQALLISYSVASGDLLLDSQSNLNTKMEEMQKGISKVSGTKYPNFQNHKAFGANGYIFSSPTDILFDENVVSTILNKIQEKTK